MRNLVAKVKLFLLIFFMALSALAQERSPLKNESSQRISIPFDNGKSSVSKRSMRSSSGDIQPYWVSPEIKVPLENVTPFLAFSIRWTGEDLQTSSYSVDLRYATDHPPAWTLWESYEFDGHVSAPEENMLLSKLKTLPANTSYVQIRVRPVDEENMPSIHDLKFFFYSPGEDPVNIQQDHKEADGQQRMAAACPKPPVVSRGSWGARAPSGSIGTSNVRFLIVHHSDGTNSSSNWAAVVRGIQNFHMDTRGWSDVGYNFLIAPNGVIYEGRYGGDNAVGAHFCQQNVNTMGVCMLGTYTSVTPTTASQNALGDLLGWKAAKEGIDPFGTGNKSGVGVINNIAGHRDAGCSVCPGNGMYNILPSIRNKAGNCHGGCQASLALTGEISSGTYKSSHTITSSGTIEAGSTVTFNAPNQITLQEGFFAKSGAGFTAKIGSGCETTTRAMAVAYTDGAPTSPVDEHSDLPSDEPMGGFKLYPNPASSEVTVEYPVEQNNVVAINVLDFSGKKVLQLPEETIHAGGIHTTFFKTDNLPPGRYFVKINTSGRVEVKFLIIE